MKGYKGFDKNLQCRGKQYEIGKTYKEGEAELCKKGLHFCESPLDCIGYYLIPDARFAEIEAEGVTDEKGDDSKRVAKKVKVIKELTLKELIEAAVREEGKNYSRLAASGDYSRLVASGDYSSVAVTGENAVAAAIGMGCIASGALGCWITLAEWKIDGQCKLKIVCVKSVKVDGVKIKAGTFYTLKNKKFVEVKDE